MPGLGLQHRSPFRSHPRPETLLAGEMSFIERDLLPKDEPMARVQSRPNKINRRTLLKGVGVTMALPWLESLSAWGSEPSAHPSAPAYPRRFAVLFMGNG